MKLPRQVSGIELVGCLEKLGYRVTRQTGSHIRLTREELPQHHVTVPNHSPLRLGTLSSIVNEVAVRLRLSRSDLISRLFGE